MRGLRQTISCRANVSQNARSGPSSACSAFSLIELLIVAALLLVLTTLYWGSTASGRESRKKACQENLQKIYIALQIYSGDYGGKFPETGGAQTSEGALYVLVPRYTADTSVFICPASRDSALPEGESFRNRTISYAYYMGRRSKGAPEALLSDRQINTLAKSSGAYAFSSTGDPPGNNHNKYGGNFLFTDGHVESSPAKVPFSLPLTQGVFLLNPRP